MEMGEKGVNNLEYEVASTRFEAPDAFIGMESAYDFDPDGGQLDRFSDFNQEGTAFAPPVLPTPVRNPTGPPGDHGISDIINRASAAAIRFVRPSSSPLGMGVNVLGAAQEEAIYSTPVVGSRQATKREGNTRVNLYYCQEENEICRGGVAGNVRVCSFHPTICAFASHATKLALSPGWYIQAPSTNGEMSFFRSPSVP